jgi:heme/copper-type cytochrome/quinol oxidase subunit 2
VSRVEENKGLAKNWRSIALLMTIIVASAGALFSAYYLGLFNTRSVPPSVHFTIIQSNQGFNDSAMHGIPWPIMNVVQGQTVTILVENNDTSSSHGFAITRYFAAIQLRPGESHNVTFVADQTGEFLVYCTITCPVHALMQNGQLKVSS